MKTRETLHSLHFVITLLLAVVAGCSSNDDDGIRDDGDTTDTDGAPLPMITRANYESLVAQVFELYTGNSYNKPLLALANDNLLDAEVVEQWYTYEYLPVEHTRFACDEGSAELDREHGRGNEADSFVNLTYRFDDCLDQGVQRRGNVEAYDGRYGMTVRSDALSFHTLPELATSFLGYVGQQRESPHAGLLYDWDTRDVELVTRTIDGDLALEGMTSRFIARDWTDLPTVSASLEGGFTMRSDATDGRAITATITLPFSYSWNQDEPSESSGGQLPEEETDSTVDRSNNWYFESGQLELRAEDGSVLLLDADTGVPDTVLVTLDNADENEHFETSWAPWQPLLRLDAYPSTRVDWVSPWTHADPATSPAIDTENALALLDLIFGQFAGEGQREPLLRVLDLMNSLEPLETEHDRGVRHDLFACPGGGTAQAWRVDEESVAPRDYRLMLAACEWEEYRFDGEVRGQEMRTDGGARSLQTEHVEWLDGEGTVHRFSGSLTRGGVEGGESDTAMTRCSWSMSGVNLVNDDVDAVSVLTTGDARFEARFRLGDAEGPAVSLDGKLTLVGSATGGHVLQAVATELASDLLAEGFVSGQLKIWADDDSELALEVIEGGTRIVVRNLAGEVELDTPWTSWQEHLSAADASICEAR